MKSQELEGEIPISKSPTLKAPKEPSESFITLPSSPKHTIITRVEEDEQDLSYLEKLNSLKKSVPRFSSDLKFWPVFDTNVLCRYSFVFYYHYELYLFLLKVLLLMTVLTVIYYGTESYLQINGANEASMWLFFGYSLVTIVAIRLYFMKQEKTVLQARNHQAEDWTENKFSVLVHGLPLDVKKEEIKEFFEDKIIEHGYHEKVREIMLLQECNEFMKLNKKLKRTEKTKRNTIGNKQSLIDDISRLQDQVNTILGSVENYELYGGTAIVIFETLQGKIIIENHFRVGKIRRFLYSVMPVWFGKRYRLKGNFIRAKEAPEPSDLIFERVYIPRYTIVSRKILTYVLGNSAVLIGIGFIVTVRLSYNGKNLADWLNFPFFLYSTVIIVITAAIYLFTDYLIEKIIISRRKSECEIEKIKIRLIISYLSINAYLIVLMQLVPSFQIFQNQVFLTAILLAVFIPLRKIFSAISIRKLWLRRKLYKDPYCLEKYSEQEIIDIFTNPEYDFANNVEDLVCFMFFALGFYFIGQLYIVGITLIGLIVSICIDKFVMVHFTSPTRIKGSEMGLDFFRILRWDIRLQLLTIAFLSDTAFAEQIPGYLRITLYVFYGIFLLWDFRENPRKIWKRKWSKERESTKYSEVERFFPHTYKKEYPYKVY